MLHQTGSLSEDAPALDPVSCWRVEWSGTTIYAREKLIPAARVAPPSAASLGKVVIVGGGAAGLAAAQTLRLEGYAGSLTVLSAGFAEIVALYLPRADFPTLDVRANRLHCDGGAGWECVCRDSSPFGHDKAAALREAHRQGRQTVYVGDGLSDHDPAEVADEVFAKPALARYCRARGIRCAEFRRFEDVRRTLEAALAGA